MKTMQFLLIPLLSAVALAQSADVLGSEMARLRVYTALLIPSQAVEEFPVWSPDSRYLAVNIRGKWSKLDISKVQLQEATWHGQQVGAASQPRLEPMAKRDALAWAKHAQHGVSGVVERSGVKAEIQREKLSSSLVLSQGTRSWVVWKSDLENCGELASAPDGVYLAYICETNGVVVMDLKRALQTLRIEP